MHAMHPDEFDAALAEFGGAWWRVDIATGSVRCSENCRAVLGLPPGAVLDAEALAAVRPFPPTLGKRFETLHRGPNGPVRSMVVRHLDAEGRVVEVRGLEFPETPTEHDGRTVDAGHADAQLVHDILAVQPALVCRYTLDGRVVWCNEAYAAHLGGTPEEVTGTSWLARASSLHFDTQEHLDELLAHLLAVTADGATSTVMAPMSMDDSTRWIQWTNRRIIGAAGGADLMQAIGVEVTELRQARDALAALSRELVAGRVSERRELARRLHDDVMQILVSAGWSMAPADDGSLSAGSAERAVELVQLAVQQLRELLAELSAPPVLLGRLADAVAAEARAMRAAGMHVEIELCEVPDEELRTVCTRVLVEGLRNVMRHAAASEVHVTLRRIGDHVVGSIADNGVGASGDDLTVALAAGHVGLLMARAMVESLGGTLEVERQGRSTGMCVTFRIPVRADRGGVADEVGHSI